MVREHDLVMRALFGVEFEYIRVHSLRMMS